MTIGIVTAIAVELATVRAVLDEVRDLRVAGDPGHYCVGALPSADEGTPHRVAAVMLTRDGTRNAAAAVVDMARSFPSMRVVVMCGIAAGLPAAGVRLGDVVSATQGIVDYGHLRATNGYRELRRASGDISTRLLAADNQLAVGQHRGQRPWEPVLATLERANATFRRPSPEGGPPLVHRGAIGSADVLLRDEGLRDGLADAHGIIAFEMEGSGISVGAALHGREWFMVRGVSDLADDRKNDGWHGCAAAGAAAYVRALLGVVQPVPAVEKAAGRPGRVAALALIVEAMLAVRLVRDEHERRLLVDELPTYIRSVIAYSPTARTHVISIVRACEGFEEGRAALLAAVGLLLGAETAEFAHLEETVRQNWNGV
ncbi:effector-associated domain 2-containing protein [Winogradskya consettensis]|uniref:effector-associated domain 2-containing protein n=1 Tax=Winogradskya consettensis TaxID=113560 RepID=UPI001BB34426|nr:hypothetical protein [Actinoplanes consettensis]